MNKQQTIAQLRSIANHLQRSYNEDEIIREFETEMCNQDNTPARNERLQISINSAKKRNEHALEMYATELSAFVESLGLPFEVVQDNCRVTQTAPTLERYEANLDEYLQNI